MRGEREGQAPQPSGGEQDREGGELEDGEKGRGKRDRNGREGREGKKVSSGGDGEGAVILFYHTETLKRAGGENGGKEEAVFRDIFDGFCMPLIVRELQRNAG